MAKGADPDQTAPIGAVCSGSKLFASILHSSVMLGNYLQQTTFSGAFFLGSLMANFYKCTCIKRRFHNSSAANRHRIGGNRKRQYYRRTLIKNR